MNWLFPRYGDPQPSREVDAKLRLFLPLDIALAQGIPVGFEPLQAIINLLSHPQEQTLQVLPILFIHANPSENQV